MSFRSNSQNPLFSTEIITPALLQRAHLEAIKTLEIVPFSLKGSGKSSLQGHVLQDTPGNSLDFYDHRTYEIGDDPRYIDWRAFARTGSYTLKLFQQEIAPKLEIIIDLSHSMIFNQAKAIRSFSLLYLALEMGIRSQSSIRIFGTGAEELLPYSEEILLTYDCHALNFSKSSSGAPLAIAEVPLRYQSQRILISDLLFADDPSSILSLIASREGQGAIFCPFLDEEEDPDWFGNLSLQDCETADQRKYLITDELLTEYRATYARHFDNWRDAATRFHLAILRFSASRSMGEELLRTLQSGTYSEFVAWN